MVAVVDVVGVVVPSSSSSMRSPSPDPPSLLSVVVSTPRVVPVEIKGDVIAVSVALVVGDVLVVGVVAVKAIVREGR